MRKFKFRVWDLERFKWIYYDDMELSYDGPDNEYVITLEHFIKEDEKYVIEQWSGLVDKDGKEIFEGDILEIHNYQFPGVVEYMAQGATCFGFWRYYTKFGEDGYFESLGDWTGVDGYKIIGNIHETPELLKNDRNSN